MFHQLFKENLLPLFCKKKCVHCEENEKYLLKKEDNNSTNANTSSHFFSGVLNSSGRSLGNNIRSFMESRFNYDFSNIKIHCNRPLGK